MTLRLCTLAVFFCCFFFLAQCHEQRTPSPTPSPVTPVLSPVPYTHNWADSAGVTHFASCFLTNFTLTAALANSDPDFVNVAHVSSPASLELLQSPVGWTGGWHKNGYPQLVFFIEGTGEWTSSDNTTRRFKKGDLYFGEDQLATTGHTSKNTGHVPLTLALVQFRTWAPTVDKPCWLQ